MFSRACQPRFTRSYQLFSPREEERATLASQPCPKFNPTPWIADEQTGDFTAAFSSGEQYVSRIEFTTGNKLNDAYTQARRSTPTLVNNSYVGIIISCLKRFEISLNARLILLTFEINLEICIRISNGYNNRTI